jgi:hypothetical protein
MTDDQSADRIIADIFGPPPSKRECALINRIALLEGRILDLEEAKKTLEQCNSELLDRIATLQGML